MDTVTGQQEISSLNDSDVVPAAAKGKEGICVCDGVRGRPNEFGMQFWPDFEGDLFKPGHGPKFGVPDLLDGQKLTPEQPVSEIVCIQLETIAEWGLALEVEGFDTPTSPKVSCESADPDVNVRGDGFMLSEGVTNALGEEGSAGSTACMVLNNSLVKSKNRNSTRGQRVNRNSALPSN